MRVRVGLMAGLSSAALLAGCGDPDNVYVSEEGSGLFLRLPPDWEVFPLDGGEPAADPAAGEMPGRWSVMLDGATEPDRSHLEDGAPTSPVGFVQIVPIALLQSRPALTQETLRSLLTPDGSDPLAAPGGVSDVDYREIDQDSHWGNRLVATLGEVRVAQLALFDHGGERIHVVRVFCVVDCFERHADEIADVLASFTLEG